MKWTTTILEDAVLLTPSEFLSKYDVSYDALRKKLYHGEKRQLTPTMQAAYERARSSISPMDIPNARPPVLQKPLHHKDPFFGYFSDLHCPLHSERMLFRYMHIAEKEFQIDTTIIGGDLTNQAHSSKHARIHPEEPYKDEKESTAEVLQLLKRDFDNLYLIPGNHDQRLAKASNTQHSFEEFIKGLLPWGMDTKGMRVTEYSYMYIGEDWLVGHPKGYRKDGGKKPAQIAQIVQKNVIAAHNHVIGYMQTEDGKWVGIDPGHMTDSEYHPYVILSMPEFSQWNAGFVIVYNNKPYMFNNLLTDWKRWGCK